MIIVDAIQWATKFANDISHGNQFMAGVVMASFSTVAIYFGKTMPLRFLSFMKAQFTTSLTFNNAGWEQRQTFIRLSNFIHERCTEFGSRTIMVESSYDWRDGRSKMMLTIGSGNHFFFYKGRPLLLTRIEHGNNQGDTIKEVITLFKFGRSHKLFHDLVEENKPKATGQLVVSAWEKGEWRKTGEVDCAGIRSVALDLLVREFFIKEFTKFVKGKDDCRRLGIPHKLSMILHGLPGSGKTSIIRALAAEFDLNVCTLDLSCISDRELMMAVSLVPRNSILLIEDFDSASHLKSRQTEEVSGGLLSLANIGTLSGVLNALDGVASLNDVVVMMTTNHLEQIDPALIRPGRIDHVVELPAPGEDAIRDHFIGLYPDIESHTIQWGAIPGCIIHRIKQAAMTDSSIAASMITHYVTNPELAAAEQKGQVEHLERIKAMQRQMAEEAAKEAKKPKQVPANAEISDSDSPVAA